MSQNVKESTLNDQSIELSQARGTVFFGRKVSDGNYGGTEAGIHVQFDLAVDDPSQTLNNINDAFATAQDAVLTQLGIAHEWDGNAQRVVQSAPEVIEKAAVKQVKKVFSPAAAAAKEIALGDTGDANGNWPSDPAPRIDDGDGGPSCPECKGGMWDNREGKKNPRQPDYRCKASKEGCSGVIWPPRKGN